jgi:hypothetical protein
MSKRSFSRAGGAGPNAEWEARLRATARTFPYPPTPDIARAVRSRLDAESARRLKPRPRLAWAVIAVLLILGGLLAVPQVRAAVVQFLQIGAIRIFLTEPTPTMTPTLTPSPSPLPPAAVTSSAIPTEEPPAATPQPTPTPLSSVLDLAGETTLVEAQAQIDFPIHLPSYPSDLGPPDRVFLQDLGGPVVVLVWLDPDQPDRVRHSLHQLGPGTFGQKLQPLVIQETTVHGQPALWTEGPYLLQFQRGGQVVYEGQLLVTGHVLVWVEEDITYRLETDLSLEEAIQIAESLR